MPVRRIVIGIGVSLISICAAGANAFALETQKAREIMDGILMQNGISATETSAENSNGAVTFTYDGVRLDLSGYSTARELALEDVRVTLSDTDIANQVDIDIALPERGKMLADATSDQRELTMRKALGSLRWNYINGTAVNFTGAADFLIGDEPITRKHWLMNGLVIRWLPDEARISWQAAEWTGPNRENAARSNRQASCSIPAKMAKPILTTPMMAFGCQACCNRAPCASKAAAPACPGSKPNQSLKRASMIC